MSGYNSQRRGTVRTLTIISELCCSVYCFVSFYVLFVCKWVLYYCHRVSTQLQLNISYQSAYKNGKVVSPTHRPPSPQGNIPGTRLCYRLSQPQGHCAGGRIMSMKNSNDTIGNRTRDLPAYSAVPQQTAPPRGTPTNAHDRS
jgi:hypothetical protein